MATAELERNPALTAVPIPDIDARTHRPLEELESAFQARTAPPKDSGSVSMILSRLAPGKNDAPGSRATPHSVLLSATGGIPGDRWGRSDAPAPDMQIAVMEASVADLIANGQPWLLFGDNLFVDLDLSAANLPAGTRLRAGAALLEVTPEPHDGCQHFNARFGNGALRFVAGKATRSRNCRGIYMKVIEDGELQVGDPIEVIRRGA